MHQNLKLLLKQDKMYDICGLRYATGMVVGLNSFLVTSELGQRHD